MYFFYFFVLNKKKKHRTKIENAKFRWLLHMCLAVQKCLSICLAYNTYFVNNESSLEQRQQRKMCSFCYLYKKNQSFLMFIFLSIAESWEGWEIDVSFYISHSTFGQLHGSHRQKFINSGCFFYPTRKSSFKNVRQPLQGLTRGWMFLFTNENLIKSSLQTCCDVHFSNPEGSKRFCYYFLVFVWKNCVFRRVFCFITGTWSL